MVAFDKRATFSFARPITSEPIFDWSKVGPAHSSDDVMEA
jgi:hypothetical protein